MPCAFWLKLRDVAPKFIVGVLCTLSLGGRQITRLSILAMAPERAVFENLAPHCGRGKREVAIRSVLSWISETGRPEGETLVQESLESVADLLDSHFMETADGSVKCIVCSEDARPADGDQPAVEAKEIMIADASPATRMQVALHCAGRKHIQWCTGLRSGSYSHAVVTPEEARRWEDWHFAVCASVSNLVEVAASENALSGKTSREADAETSSKSAPAVKAAPAVAAATARRQRPARRGWAPGAS